jgi:hypothetical protein
MSKRYSERSPGLAFFRTNGATRAGRHGSAAANISPVQSLAELKRAIDLLQPVIAGSEMVQPVSRARPMLRVIHAKKALCFAAVHESVVGVRREKAALSSGCKSHPANAPAGSNRGSYGGNEVAEAFG